jgi:hypothetical protein
LIKVKEWVLINDRRQNLCKEWFFAKKQKEKSLFFILADVFVGNSALPARVQDGALKIYFFSCTQSIKFITAYKAPNKI